MADTPAQIANLALAKVGVTEFLTDPDFGEDTAAARVSAVVYPQARDALLEAFAWPFATKRAPLAQLAGEERSGWVYAYELPDDCVAAQRIWPGSRNPQASVRIPFAIEATDALDGMVVLTDQQNAELIYTARVVLTGRYPRLFVEALVWELAKEFALSLLAKPALLPSLEQKAALALARAKAAALNSMQSDVAPESELISVRG